jgi:hypothetical protein
MARTLQMKQHDRVIITLRSDLSLYDGRLIYRVTHDPADNSRQVMAICERLERTHQIGDWCTIDDLMEELQSFRIWLYEGSRYTSVMISLSWHAAMTLRSCPMKGTTSTN